jgi:hypothetical protein
MNMHELVTGDNVQAMQEAVAQDPKSVNQLNESGLPRFTPPRSIATKKQSNSVGAWSSR